MNGLRIPRRSILALGVLLILVAVGSTALAQEGDLITACVTSRGTVRIVDASEVCSKSETRLAWGITGPQGPQGETGPAGPEGPQGPQGPAGELSLAGKSCSGDQFVTGFDPNGDLVCAAAIRPSPTPVPDADGDGVLDAEDNCLVVYNPDQADADANGVGDACEPQPEVCDGVDNDIDGPIDEPEDLPSEPCETGVGPGMTACIGGAWMCWLP